ncbi:MAG: D-alanine--D-alanine ligase [Nitrospirae bacterium RBG_13_43_8]|nr:MAG: D-alanine--D-alanine ligase [Nitrospirae bacterium RBG_13_43_8]
MLTDKRIGVLMGGKSTEREVSLRSGKAICTALKDAGYDVVAIDTGPDICEALQREKIGIAFIALHGGHGENGAVQGMLEVLEIPYTGSGILASALAMDKEASKKIFLYHKIPVPPFEVLSREKGAKSINSLHIGFSIPWVVKPATEGSSIGVNIVRDKGQVRSAVEKAFALSDRAIIEKYIEGREVHIGVLNNKALGGVEVRPSLEFYSYEAKYQPGLTEYILPPEVNNTTYEEAKETALSAHIALGCRGATRTDLRIDKDGNPHVLEVNTIPGMTETSLLPKVAKLAGLDFPALIEEILRGALNEN